MENGLTQISMERIIFGITKREREREMGKKMDQRTGQDKRYWRSDYQQKCKFGKHLT